MKQKVRFFRQHSLETCGISCILMVLHSRGKLQYPTAKQERKLYEIYRCRAFKGTLGAAIADCLTRNRLSVTLFHSSCRYLDNRDMYYPEALYQALRKEYAEGVEALRGRAAGVETGCRFSSQWYREQLEAQRMLIVQCVVPGDADGMHDRTLHWILVYGYEEDEFLACDPLSGKIRLTEKEMEYYTDTPVGSICISVGGDA